MRQDLSALGKPYPYGLPWVGGELIIEGDSKNAIKWALGLKRPPRKLITIVREIRALYSGRVISFMPVRRSVNGVADFFAKNGMDSTTVGMFYLQEFSRRRSLFAVLLRFVWIVVIFFLSTLYGFIPLRPIGAALCTLLLLI